MHSSINFVNIRLNQLAGCVLNQIHRLSIQNILPLVYEILSRFYCWRVRNYKKRQADIIEESISHTQTLIIELRYSYKVRKSADKTFAKSMRNFVFIVLESLKFWNEGINHIIKDEPYNLNCFLMRNFQQIFVFQLLSPLRINDLLG